MNHYMFQEGEDEDDNVDIISSYYCFICGKGCGGRGGGVERSWSSMRTLLGLLCKLMSVPGWKNNLNGEVEEEEEEERTSSWDSQTCGDCYQVLIQMEQLNALLERTRSSLEHHVKQVESLVVKSGAENVFCLRWTAPFRAFREQVIEAALRTTRFQPDQVPMMMPPPPPPPNVKVEVQVTNTETMEQWGGEQANYSPEHEPDNNNAEWEWEAPDPLSSPPPPPPETSSLPGRVPSITAPQHPNPESFVKTEPILLELNQAKGIGDSRRRSPRSHNQTLTPCFVRLEKFDPPLLTSPRRAGHKRNYSGGLHSRSPKKTKSTREDDATDGESNDDSLPNEADYAPSTPSSSSDNDDDADSGSDYRDDGDDDEQQEPAKRSKKSKTKSYSAKGNPAQNKRSPPFVPFVIADAVKELYLFRQGTFVRKTPAHLICHAFKCSFRVELSYYTAFQEMKSHILQFHGSYRHRQQTKHPCILCNSTFSKQSTFRAHLPHQHPHLLDNNSTGICESCLKPLRPSPGGLSVHYWRAHMATHKSQEEKEAADLLALASRESSTTTAMSQKTPRDGDRRRDPEVAKAKQKQCTWEGCSYASNHSRNLLRHMQTHLPPEERTDQATCDQCGVSVHKDSLKAHVLSAHNPELAETILQCGLCDRKYFTWQNSAYQVHLLTHEGVKPFACDQCDATYNSQTGLRCHVQRKHKPQPETPIKCDHCDKTYTRIRSLACHVRRRHSDLVPPLKRSGKRVSKLNALGREPMEAEDAKKHKCTWGDGCTYASNHSRNLRRHMQTHLPPEERTDRTTCDQCGASVKKDSLKAHVLTAHNPELAETILQCQYCDKKYFTWQNSYYQTHLLIHQGIMAYVCSECGAGFSHQSSLLCHMKGVHAPPVEAPIKCDHCDRTYTKRRSLDSHVRKHHSDIVPLKWKGKRVSKLNRLGTSAEEEEEGGEKKPVYGPIQRWPCSSCDVICSHKCALQRHMSTKHGVQNKTGISSRKDDADHSSNRWDGGKGE